MRREGYSSCLVIIVNTDTRCSGFGAGNLDIRSYIYASSSEIAEREPAGMYCVGCGSDLTSRSTDRRSLQSSASEHVSTVWKTYWNT